MDDLPSGGGTPGRGEASGNLGQLREDVALGYVLRSRCTRALLQVEAEGRQEVTQRFRGRRSRQIDVPLRRAGFDRLRRECDSGL